MEATEKKFVENGTDEGCCSNNPVDFSPPVTPKQEQYPISVAGFQIPMLPSLKPPTIRPQREIIRARRILPLRQPVKWLQTWLGTNYRQLVIVDWKSSWRISRFVDVLKDISTASAIVPAIRYDLSGANATTVDLLTSFMLPIIVESIKI